MDQNRLPKLDLEWHKTQFPNKFNFNSNSGKALLSSFKYRKENLDRGKTPRLYCSKESCTKSNDSTSYESFSHGRQTWFKEVSPKIQDGNSRGHSESPNFAGNKGNDRLFYKKCNNLEWTLFRSSGKPNIHRLRFINFGFQLYPKWRKNPARALESTGKGRTHQHKGIVSYSKSFGTVDDRIKESKFAHKNRQPGSLLLSQKSWWKNSTLEFYRKEQYLHSKNLLGPNRPTLFSRRSESKFRRNRMRNFNKTFRGNKQDFWSFGQKQIRFRQKQDTKQIHFSQQNPWKNSRGNRCTFSNMEWSPQLCMSPFKSYLPNYRSDSKSKSRYVLDHSCMEKPNLVPEGNEFGVKIPGSHFFSPELLWCKRDSSRSVKKSKVNFQGDKNNLLSWAPLISQSWAESTRSLYLKVWKKFEVWCESKGVSSLPPSLNSVLSFMFDLSLSAASQVKTFIAVLAVIHNLNGWKSPYSFDAIKRLSKAIEKKRPKNKKVNAFPIEILLHHLQKKKSERNSNWLRDALIVSICTRTTFRAETLIALNAGQISFKKINRLEFAVIEVLKSKTNQTGDSYLYYIDPNTDNPKLCIVKLLRKYIQLKSETHSPSDAPLFTNENGERLSTNQISNIVSKMARKAGNNSKFSSRSLRVGSVNWMINAGFSLESIKALGWTESSNAVNCYIRSHALSIKGATQKMMSQGNQQI